MSGNKKIIYKDLKQQTEAWEQIRVGKISGSEYYKIIGKEDSALNKDYINCKISENIIKKAEDKKEFFSYDIDRGIILESEAREKFKEQYKLNVEQVGFISKGEFLGCSPDGVIYNENGDIRAIIEIKCRNNSNFVSEVLDKDIKKEYLNQCYFNMWIADCKICYYINYNTNYGIYVKEVFLTEDKAKEIEQNCRRATEKIIDGILQFKDNFEKQDLLTLK